ncbi:PhzF family phenazine biosynthesis protein [Azospirillum sp. SYSU D00513]|uniref:PhzF family phenazine biosynthesis protein n=1 Tax=Azospirillum sp. SYSU D00513 TaxID=2812561 RepID=UPI001A95EC9F|nr:PhzF family phenazine biosynthesis protein [Azospirillum sp. SYSU D00513]
MRTLDFITADVFTDRLFGGNPLAVFPDGRGLDDATMQAIARELNLSETVFVLPPSDRGHTRDVRIFTPSMELPFAGHPTIGTAIILAEIGALEGDGPWSIVLGEKVGPIPVRIDRPQEGPLFAVLSSARLPEAVADAPPLSILARLLGLPLEAITRAGSLPAVYSAGVPFTIVPVASRAALSAIRLDLSVWRAEIAETASPHLFPVFMEDWQAGRSIHARMFAPAMGIAEDPATGAAATALAGFLAARQTLGTGLTGWNLHQGEDMGRPSLIRIEAETEAGRPHAVRIGGSAVTVSRGTFRLPG